MAKKGYHGPQAPAQGKTESADRIKDWFCIVPALDSCTLTLRNKVKNHNLQRRCSTSIQLSDTHLRPSCRVPDSLLHTRLAIDKFWALCVCSMVCHRSYACFLLSSESCMASKVQQLISSHVSSRVVNGKSECPLGLLRNSSKRCCLSLSSTQGCCNVHQAASDGCLSTFSS